MSDRTVSELKTTEGNRNIVYKTTQSVYSLVRHADGSGDK
jgi:hypothetical protein